MKAPRLVVFSSLFPSSSQPGAGLFIRERMFRVGKRIPLIVVSPQPWFPFQSLIGLVRPGYRPATPNHELQDGVDVYFPRFFALPGILRRFDGFMMALGALPLLLRLRRHFLFNVLDAHFAYPSGYAAVLLGRWLGMPVTITLRGTEPGHTRRPALLRRVRRALNGATRIFAVSASLKKLAIDLGIDPEKIRVIGNGVDLQKFHPSPRDEARGALGLSPHCKVLVSVGGLVERKGFHRVIEILPRLLQRFPGLRYMVVGGISPEGEFSQTLRAQVKNLRLEDTVQFTGPLLPEQLRLVLSAADVFVLATSNEGWANVFLEAMACGLPVVTTDVGGNPEVVCSHAVGTIVPFGDSPAFQDAVTSALERDWDRDAIRAYAETQTWDKRVKILVEEFNKLIGEAEGDCASQLNV